jgi:chemotaxis signal transduction protein
MIPNRRITDFHDIPANIAASEDAEVKQFVSFLVGEQQYCVDIMAVRETCAAQLCRLLICACVLAKA